MHKPKFITFTGADEHTDPVQMAQLAHEYPIEWGILFSPSRQGTGRYPPISWVDEMLCTRPFMPMVSAHICGGHSRALLQKNGRTEIDAFLEGKFDRVQINTSDPGVDIEQVARWAESIFAKPILQCRNEEFIPHDERVTWLFDASGGKGKSPCGWPRQSVPTDALHGYAGGLSPENITRQLLMIEWEAGPNYYLDMESGVRDENDRFDLGKCRAVCEAVYGRA